MSGSLATQIHNERIKLLATLLNTVAGSSFTLGIAAPLAAMSFYSPANLRFAPAAIGMIIWTNVIGFFHLAARQTRGGLTS